MAWQDVQPIIGNSANAKGRVHYKVSQRYGCTVSIPPEVAKALGWTVGARLGLAIGGGEVEGKLRLTPDAGAQPVLQKAKGETLMVRLGRWAQLPAREVDRVAVEHEIHDGALILTLPRHALLVAPAPRVPAPAVPTAAARSPFAVGAKVDVTDRVAGRNGNGGVAPASGTRTGGR